MNPNEIANIIKATNIIMDLPEPSIQSVYDAVKSVMSIIEEILPGNVGAYQEIHFGDVTIKKAWHEYNTWSLDNKDARYEFSIFRGRDFAPWFSVGYQSTRDQREDVIERTLRLDKAPEFWFEILEHRDDGIADAIRIKQSLCAEKVARILSVR